MGALRDLISTTNILTDKPQMFALGSKMNNQDISDYRKYVENLDWDSVLDISRNIDKDKYPEKWEIIDNYLKTKQPEQKKETAPSFLSDLWRGNIPLVKTFWLFWLLPAVAFPVLQSIFTYLLAPFLGILYLLVYFLLNIAFTIYQVICIKGLWSSATKYEGKPLWRIATKLFIIAGIVLTVYSAYAIITSPKADTDDPGRTAEKGAVPTEEFPLAGFYKDKVSENFGWAIGPNDDGTYYISFCGPGGCFKPGTYLPNTTIVNDPNYEVIDNNTIKFKRTGSMVKRAPGNKR